MLDLLITNAALPDGRTGIDIACANGKIADIGRLGTPQAHRTIDARGYLVSPPFVDAHFHMDATLSLGIPRLNESGTLLEGIALWGELKSLLTVEAVVERTLQDGVESGDFTVEDPTLLANLLYASGLGTLQLARVGILVKESAPGVPAVGEISHDQVRRHLVTSALALATR